MNGTIARSYYPTRLNIFIDDQQVSTYLNTPSPQAQTTNRSDFRYLTTFADIGGLDPGPHTFRAQSVGADCLFVLDSITYEPDNNEDSFDTPEPSLEAQDTSFPSDSVSPTSVSTSSPSALATAAIGQISVTEDMDITPSDARITYSPPGSWVASAPARRSARLSRRASCHDGTKTASNAGDSLTYTFTGKSHLLAWPLLHPSAFSHLPYHRHLDTSIYNG